MLLFAELFLFRHIGGFSNINGLFEWLLWPSGLAAEPLEFEKVLFKRHLNSAGNYEAWVWLIKLSCGQAGLDSLII